MAEVYFPFQTGSGTSVTESYWSMMARLFIASGVVKGALNELQVYADSTGMQVKVKSGRHAIMGLMYQSDAEQIIPIAAADPTNPRIDVIAIRLDWVANTIAIVVLEGTPAANPVAPALTQTDILVTPGTARWEIALANVNVPAAATTIAAGNITDGRTYTGFPPSLSAIANTIAVRDANGALNANSGGSVMTTNDSVKRSAFRAWMGTAQSISAYTTTKIAYNNKEYDNLGEYNNATYQFTAQKTGIYLFTAGVSLASNPDGGYCAIDVFVNATTAHRVFDGSSGSATGFTPHGTCQIKLNAGDFVEVDVYISNALSTNASQASTYFEGVQIA